MEQKILDSIDSDLKTWGGDEAKQALAKFEALNRNGKPYNAAMFIRDFDPDCRFDANQLLTATKKYLGGSTRPDPAEIIDFHQPEPLTMTNLAEHFCISDPAVYSRIDRLGLDGYNKLSFTPKKFGYKGDDPYELAKIILEDCEKIYGSNFVTAAAVLYVSGKII